MGGCGCVYSFGLGIVQSLGAALLHGAYLVGGCAISRVVSCGVRGVVRRAVACFTLATGVRVIIASLVRVLVAVLVRILVVCCVVTVRSGHRR